jgi:hypothetical protein
MAIYDPPQPLWKRNLAGILDFLLIFLAVGNLLSRLPGHQSYHPPLVPAPGTQMVEVVGVSGPSALLLIGIITGYFVIMGRTGGTIFQRLFRMKRVRRALIHQ